MIIVLLCVSVSVVVYVNFRNNYDTGRFAYDMDKLGYNSVRTGPVNSYPLSGSLTYVYVGNTKIDVYEYKDFNRLRKEVSLLKTDAKSKTPAIHWVTPPHFFKKGRLIVGYIGDDGKLISDLEKILGKPITEK